MDQRIKKILDHLEDHPEQSYNLDELAAMACLSPSQFHRTFKKATGQTPFRFIEALKMNQSRRLLLSSEINVYGLADKFGYQNYETFSRAFKKHFHLSPDDLKAIANTIMNSVAEEPDQMIIATFPKKISETALKETVQELCRAHQLSEKDLKMAHIFKVNPKDKNVSANAKIIKKKFEMTPAPKIWEILLQ